MQEIFLKLYTAYSGRICEDGAFHYDGYLTTSGHGELNYQFRRSVKGALNDVYLSVGDLSAYEEWYYKTDKNREITLDLGPDRGFLPADLGGSFPFVNVLAGSFDFSLLTPARPPEESP